jgi:hypothetical protein
VSRRLLLPIAFLLTAFALFVAVTGGFVTTSLGFRFSSRSPLPSLVAAATSFVAWYIAAARRGAVTADLIAVDRWMTRHWRQPVGLIAIAAASIAMAFNTFSATGSDASGYLSYADMLWHGQLMRPEPLSAIARWADGPATLAPLGWRAALEAGYQVPTYAIGLPLLLAPLHAAAGVIGASLLAPLALAVVVFSTAGLAHRLGGSVSALLAAVWLATSPVALLESMQIMTDVPVTAAWLVCWWLVFTQKWGAAGVATALAVLIRPNLAPLAVVPALAVFLSRRDGSGVPGAATGRLTAGALFAAPLLLAISLVALLQWRYFGSPLRSGYGTPAEIYALSNIAPNVRLYAQWLLETHGPWLLLAPLALVLARRELTWMITFAALVIVAYLVYAIFESWTYLRFLLPAIAVAAIAVSALVATLMRRAPAALRVPAVALLTLALAAANLASAREHGVFRFADRQDRGRDVGERLAALLPVNAVIVSGEQSGTMRYYTGRTIVRWDLMAPGAMADALGWIALNGYQVWVVLDDWEEEAFRKKFPALAAASIDHEPTMASAPYVGIRTRAWRARRTAG